MSPGDGRLNAFKIIERAVKDGAILKMPHIGLNVEDPDPIGFTDGRHRFAWMRDHGARAMPVTIDKSDVTAARKMIGSRSRLCRVRI